MKELSAFMSGASTATFLILMADLNDENIYWTATVAFIAGFWLWLWNDTALKEKGIQNGQGD